VLALVSVSGSIHYAVLPGLRRDELLVDPTVADTVTLERNGAWWHLLGADGPAGAVQAS